MNCLSPAGWADPGESSGFQKNFPHGGSDYPHCPRSAQCKLKQAKRL